MHVSELSATLAIILRVLYEQSTSTDVRSVIRLMYTVVL